MKFKKILFLITLSSCSPQLKTLNMKEPYVANGFAYIYNELDFNEKIIKGKMNNDILQISHQNLKTGTLIKIASIVLLLLVAVVLFLGIANLFKGGSKKNSNKLMQLRVILQFIAIIAIVGFAYFFKN